MYSKKRTRPKVQTTDIEKKSLEAHVDLCAQRYLFLEEKLNSVEAKVCNLNKTVDEIKTMVANITTQRNNQIITWGIGIIASLVGVIGWLVAHFVVK